MHETVFPSPHGRLRCPRAEGQEGWEQHPELRFTLLPPQETKLSARVYLQGKALRVQLDLQR